MTFLTSNTDLILKTFLDFSSLYSNPVLEAGIFAVADYYALLLMKNEKLFLDESKYKSGRNSEQYIIFNLATGFGLKYYEDSILSWLLGVTVVNGWFK